MQNSGTAEVECKLHMHYIYATIDFVHVNACLHYKTLRGWQSESLPLKNLTPGSITQLSNTLKSGSPPLRGPFFFTDAMQ